MSSSVFLRSEAEAEGVSLTLTVGDAGQPSASPALHPLDDSRAKIARARSHLQNLVRDSATWMANAGVGSMRVEKVRGPEPSTFHFIAKDVPATDPFRWGLYFGDILHNLRGALDHLAYALADRDSPGRGEDRATQFIILPDQTAFTKASWHLSHLSRRHQDMIEAEQPYVRQPADVTIHPLSVLERLSNVDKHRIIHVVSFGSDLFSFNVPSPFQLVNATITGQIIYENPLEEDVRLMSVTIAKQDPDGPDPDVDWTFSLYAPTLALAPGSLIKHIGPNLTNYASDVVERFADEF